MPAMTLFMVYVHFLFTTTIISSFKFQSFGSFAFPSCKSTDTDPKKSIKDEPPLLCQMKFLSVEVWTTTLPHLSFQLLVHGWTGVLLLCGPSASWDGILFYIVDKDDDIMTDDNNHFPALFSIFKLIGLCNESCYGECLTGPWKYLYSSSILWHFYS